jgi:cardiolipin synthase
MGGTIIVVAFLVWLVLVVLFTPRIDYRVSTPLRPDSGEFLHVIQVTCQAAVHFHNRVDILTNGAQFYPAMRDAILQATGSINLEAYIFQPGDAADMLIDAMVARARDGVDVRLVLDSIGSSGMSGRPARRLQEAGCRLYFYQPITWYRLHRLNNRTHRVYRRRGRGRLVVQAARAGSSVARHDGADRGTDRGGLARGVCRELA